MNNLPKRDDAANAIVGLVRDDIADADGYKASRLGFLTGLSPMRRAGRNLGQATRETLARTKRAIETIRYEESGPVLETDSQVPEERFEVACAQYRMSPDKLRAFQNNTYRSFLLFVALAIVIATLGFFMTGLQSLIAKPAIILNWFAVTVLMVTLATRQGFYNWQVRTRALGGFGTYLKSPSDWWAHPTATMTRDGRGGGGIKLVAVTLAVMAGVLAVMPGSAIAATTIHDVVTTPAQTDIWLHLLELLFPGVGPLGGTPTAGSTAIASALGSFIAILMAAGTSVLIWHVISGTVATAHEGTVLGKNWHQVWAPIRVVMGVGLLVPIVNGFGLAQVLVLTVAVWGGSFGDVVWNSYVSSLASSTISAPLLPQTGSVVKAFSDAEVCQASLLEKQTETGASFGDLPSGTVTPSQTSVPAIDGASALGNITSSLSTVTATSNALQSSASMTLYTWNYGPCGSISATLASSSSSTSGEAAVTYAQSELSAVTTLQGALHNAASTFIDSMTSSNATASTTSSAQATLSSALTSASSSFNSSISDAATTMAASMTSAAGSALSNFQNAASAAGWASGGTYYMVVSRMQGLANETAKNLPAVSNVGLSDGSKIDPVILGELMEPNTGWIWLYNHAYQTALATVTAAETSTDLSTGVNAGNPDGTSSGFNSVMGFLFKGIYTVVDKYITGVSSTSSVAPIQQMTDFGNDMLDVAWGIIGIGMLAAIASKFAGGGLAGKAASAVGGKMLGALAPIEWLMKVAGILVMGLIAVGVMHAFVLPMIPFIQFTFFTISMLVLVAEGVIAAPLWALAHVRMDGQELVGQQQSAGYQIIFNLFLRIPLAMFGLFLGIQIFDAAIWLLNATFYPAILSATAENSTGLIGAITMLILVSYMHWHVAMRSFGLITAVPDRVSRWFGAQSEQAPDGHSNHEAIAAFAATHTKSALGGAMGVAGMGADKARKGIKDGIKGVQGAADTPNTPPGGGIVDKPSTPTGIEAAVERDKKPSTNVEEI